MKTAVVVDSGSYYYVDNVDVEGIFAVPLQIIDGDEAFLETVDITIDEVNERMSKGRLLKTSLPSLGMIEDLFKEIKAKGYDQILAIPITSGISGTINAMVTAAKFSDIPLTYIDCFTTARIENDLATAARKYLDEGKTIEEVQSILDESISHSDTFVIPNDLEHLSRGGRLSPLAAKLGGFLKIKPILHLNKETKGVIDPFAKVRTMTKAIESVVNEMVDKGVNSEDYTITIVDVRTPELLDFAVDRIKAVFPGIKMHVHELIPTVSVHVGIGSIALQYMKNPL